jgi:hypothetical protein
VVIMAYGSFKVKKESCGISCCSRWQGRPPALLPLYRLLAVQLIREQLSTYLCVLYEFPRNRFGPFLP